jgi:putative ABC transport system permease protein
MRAVATAVRGGVRGRRVQTLVVAAVALLSTATSVIGLGLLVVSNAPFETAFARQAGAHATTAYDPARVDGEALAATGRAAGVSAAAGPFDAVTAGLLVGAGGFGIPAATVVGRADPGGPVDQLTLDEGRWVRGPGEIVLARHVLPPETGERAALDTGQSTVTIRLPGQPELRLVGIADSVTDTADAWVWPTEGGVLHTGDAPASRQMLYRFASAGSAAAVGRSLAAATATLPEGALLSSASYIASRLQADSTTGPVVPFVVAFAVLGLVMSMLVVANVVTGAVVAGFRTIGVLKSVGFTPAQVIGVYIGQVLGAAGLGALLGVALGNLVAAPVLRQAQQAYDVPAAPGLPVWVWVVAALAVLAVVGITATAAAGRAHRIPSAAALSVGRAPRTGRGYRLRRALAASRLPRPVSFGLGALSARPARSAMTMLAIAIGAATVVFAVGLAGSLTRAVEAFARTAAVPVEVELSHMETDGAAVRAAIEAQPGAAHVAGRWDTGAAVAGVGQHVLVTAYDGDSSWLGYELVAGGWFDEPGEVVASSRLLGVTGTEVGDTLVLTTEHGRLAVHIAGETFDNASDGFAVVGAADTLAPLAAAGQRWDGFAIGLAGGVDPRGYRDALAGSLEGMPADVQVRQDDSSQRTVAIMLGLVSTLTLLLTVAAALGVFNTVVLNTRERVQEIGVLKTLGMTPRQTQAMVVASMAGLGAIAGLCAVPLGWALHRAILPVMGGAVGSGIPERIRDVYSPGMLAGLALAGVALGALGALVPASWAAHAHPATALRAE